MGAISVNVDAILVCKVAFVGSISRRYVRLLRHMLCYEFKSADME